MDSEAGLCTTSRLNCIKYDLFLLTERMERRTVRQVASGNLREYGNVTLYMLIDQAEGYGLETDAKHL